MTAAVRACTGLDPDVRDSGGVAWSKRPQGAFPGRSAPLLEVDVRISDDEPDPDAVLDLVRFVVDDVRPAHVPAAVRRAPGVTERPARAAGIGTSSSASTCAYSRRAVAAAAGWPSAASASIRRLHRPSW